MKIYLKVICIVMVFGSYAQNSIDRELNKLQIPGDASVQTLLKKADNLNRSKNFSDAEILYDLAFLRAKKINDKKLIISSAFKLERFSFNKFKNYEKAMQILDYLYEYCGEVDGKDCQIRSVFRKGELNQRRGQFIKALEYYNKALQKVESSKNKNLHWEILTARGILLLDIGDADQSKKDFKKAVNYLTDKNSKFDWSIAYVNISASFSDKEADSTIYYSRLAAQGCDGDKTSRRCNLAYNNIAWSYFAKGMPKEALDILNTHIDIDNIEYSNSDSLYPALMHTLGAIYYELEDYDNALKHFEIAHKYFVIKKDITNTVMVKEDLSKTYEKLGDLRSGIRILREIKPLMTKLDSLKVTREIARIESKKVLDIKEEKISDLEEENIKIGKEISKTKWFSYFLSSFLIISISTLLYRGHKNKVRFHQLNEELSLNRLKALRSMMNPHFLFNSFSTLQNYILKKDNLKANEYMTELSCLIRNVLSSSDSIYISFKEELKILKSYIKIEKERFNKSFEVVYDIDEKLIDSNPTLPSMVVQPYIENAIIHGFSHSDKKGLLKLSFQKESNAVICKVLDNGIGRDEAERLQKQGNDTVHLSIATRNTNERLRIISKVSDDDASVIIKDLFDDEGNASGTEVIITLPILKENK